MTSKIYFLGAVMVVTNSPNFYSTERAGATLVLADGAVLLRCKGMKEMHQRWLTPE